MGADEIVLLFGGTSTERRVSVASAQHVLELLPQVTPWFITPSGEVVLCDAAEVRAHERPFERDFQPKARPLAASLEAALETITGRRPTFLLALHGGLGEDGTYQKLFEARGLPFTGSGSVASARAFDKAVAKQFAREAGVMTAEAAELPADATAARKQLEEMLAKYGRVVVKPVADGSSVGLHHVRKADDIAEVLADRQARPGLRQLAEAFIEGTELTVGVVEDERGIRALPPSEVRLVPGGAFDFQGKYLGRGTKEITPAEVPESVAKAAQQLAVTMHKALGCAGYTRTDIIATSRGPVFLETNTLPGMTKASFIPQQLAAEGTPMLSFLQGQLAMARRRI